jgi:hypothetical protein
MRAPTRSASAASKVEDAANLPVAEHEIVVRLEGRGLEVAFELAASRSASGTERTPPAL